MTNNNDTRTNYDTVQTRETSSSNMHNPGNDDDGRSSDRRRAGTTQTPRLTTATYIFAACAALNSCNLGYDIGVSTNAGGIIQRDLGLTDVQRELFIGSLNFWSIFGSLGSFWISDCYGRRKSFQVAAMLFIVGCSIMAAAQSYAVLMLGRYVINLVTSVLSAAPRGVLFWFCLFCCYVVFLLFVPLTDRMISNLIHVFVLFVFLPIILIRLSMLASF